MEHEGLLLALGFVACVGAVLRWIMQGERRRPPRARRTRLATGPHTVWSRVEDRSRGADRGEWRFTAR